MELKVFFDTRTALFGFKNQNNKIVISAQYKSATEFSEGFAVVEYEQKQKRQWKKVLAFIDEKGHETVIECEQLLPFQNGLSLALVNGSWKLIDKTFQFVDNTCLSGDPKEVFISDLETLIKLVEQNGSNVLNWASPDIFASETKVEALKAALKNYLKNFAYKIGAKKDSITKQEFMDMVLDQFHKLKDLRWEKLQQVQEWNVKARVLEEIIK